MSNPPRVYEPASATDSGWRRSVILITLMLTVLATAIALVSLAATQLTERGTAQRLLAVAADSLLEIDRFVSTAWPALEIAATDREPIPLSGFPIGLQLDPAGIDDGPEAVSDDIAAATASLIYDGGFDVLADAPQAFRLVSRGAAFDGTFGRMTRGGHSIATIALIVSGSLTILLVVATVIQTRGLTRFGAPAVAIGLGAAIVLLAAILLQSSFEGRAGGAADPFSTDLWWIAADAIGIMSRNAAIVGVAAAVVAGSALVGGALLRVVEPGIDARS